MKAPGKAARNDRAPGGDRAAAPLDEARREAMAEAALGLGSDERTDERADATGFGAAPRPPPSPAPDAANAANAANAPEQATAARPVRWHYGAVATLAFAASAAFLVVFRPAGPGGDTLPAYQLSLTGAASELRGEPAAPSAAAKVRPDATVTLVLRPSAPVTYPVEVRAFAERDGALRRVDVPTEVSFEGSLRLSARADRLFDPPRGRHRLVVAVAPRGKLPDEAPSADALRRTPGARVVEALVTVEPP